MYKTILYLNMSFLVQKGEGYLFSYLLYFLCVSVVEVTHCTSILSVGRCSVAWRYIYLWQCIRNERQPKSGVWLDDLRGPSSVDGSHLVREEQFKGQDLYM